MHVSGSQGVEARVTPLSIFPSDLLWGEYCASHLLNSVLWRGRGSGSWRECTLNRWHSQSLVVPVDMTAAWAFLVPCIQRPAGRKSHHFGRVIDTFKEEVELLLRWGQGGMCGESRWHVWMTLGNPLPDCDCEWPSAAILAWEVYRYQGSDSSGMKESHQDFRDDSRGWGEPRLGSGGGR